MDGKLTESQLLEGATKGLGEEEVDKDDFKSQEDAI
jgi:hypothetical protein